MSQATSDAWLVVGLGNPGPEYETTRHNIGFLVADAVAGRIGARPSANRRMRASVATGRLAGVPVVVAKPATFMNDSGVAVRALMDFHSIEADHVVVVHDELDLPFSHLRLKLGGGDNGHNGLRSIRQHVGHGEVHRVRFGIGRPPGQQDPASFVLRPWSRDESRDLGIAVEEAVDAVELLITHGLEAAQNQYNR